MASKVVGTTLVVLGVAALLAGLGVAAYAWVEAEKARGALVPHRNEEAEGLLVAGATGAAAGLVLFLAGLLALVVSRPKEPASSTEARAPPASAPTRRNVLVGASVALGLVALVVLGVLAAWPGELGLRFGGGPDEPKVLLDKRLNGTVQGGAVGLGLPPRYMEGNEGDVTLPADAGACTFTLTWDHDAVGSTPELQLRILREGTERLNVTGGPGVAGTLAEPPEGSARYSVTLPPRTQALVRLDYALHVQCVA